MRRSFLGPYRLDVGQRLVLLSEAEKADIGHEAQRATKAMADEAYRERLEELGQEALTVREYDEIRDKIAEDIRQLREVCYAAVRCRPGNCVTVRMWASRRCSKTRCCGALSRSNQTGSGPHKRESKRSARPLDRARKHAHRNRHWVAG